MIQLRQVVGYRNPSSTKKRVNMQLPNTNNDSTRSQHPSTYIILLTAAKTKMQLDRSQLAV